MSIVVKGMEMPKTCYDCPLGAFRYVPLWKKEYKRYDFCCVLTKKPLTGTKRNRFCPLEEEERESHGQQDN